MEVITTRKPEEGLGSAAISSNTQENDIKCTKETTDLSSGKMALINKSETDIESGILADSDIETLMYTPDKNKPKGDVNLFLQMFESLKTELNMLKSRERDLTMQISLNEKKLAFAENKISYLEKSEKVQKNINDLHNDLNQLDKLGEEKAALKDKLVETEAQLLAKEEEFDKFRKSSYCDIEKLKTQHETTVSDLRNEAKQNMEHKEKEFKEKLSEKRKEVENMKQTIEEIKSEKSAEVAVLKMEYENKMVKIQLQKAVASLQQQTSSNQEIYRRKLQHLKSEYDQETNSLRDHIRSLEQQLAVNKSRMSASSGMSAGKRPRKF